MARRSGRRADYEWFGVADTITGVDLGIGQVSLGTNSLDFAGPGTLMRLRGSLYVALDATAVNEFAVIAAGIIKVSDEALAAGAGSIPSPHTDADAEWIWHSYLTISSLAEAAVAPQALFDRAVVDSKAMRKFKSSDSLAFMVEVADSLDQGGSFDFSYGYRSLVAS